MKPSSVPVGNMSHPPAAVFSITREAAMKN
jgi:hypothetical protein